MNIAVIPARGGSKRIPKKNIRPFCGQPMISYPIRAALASNLFARVIVSTDSEEIAAVAKATGAEVPFLRPAELALPGANVAEVFAHAIEWAVGQGGKVEYACCLVATAPMLKAEFIRQAYEEMIAAEAPAAVSIGHFPHPIFRAFKINDRQRLEMLWPEYELRHSNELPETYHDAAQFYWHQAEAFLKHKKMFAEGALPFVLPSHLVRDIDTEDDWETAELMYELCKAKGYL